MTLSRRGTYANLGLPGTGLSWRGRLDGGKGRQAPSAQKTAIAKTIQTNWVTEAPDSGASALNAARRKAKARVPYSGQGFVGASTQAVPGGR